MRLEIWKQVLSEFAEAKRHMREIDRLLAESEMTQPEAMRDRLKPDTPMSEAVNLLEGAMPERPRLALYRGLDVHHYRLTLEEFCGLLSQPDAIKKFSAWRGVGGRTVNSWRLYLGKFLREAKK